jgi:hypothetical protein
LRRAGLLLLALVLTGCETTAQRSATLERAALKKAHGAAKQTGLAIHGQSRSVEVVNSTILHSPEGTAAVVTLRNRSRRAVGDSPLLISVRAGNGSIIYSNDVSGLAHSLVSAPLIPSHGEITWIDDQVQSPSTPASVTTRVGEGRAFEGSLPRIDVEGGKLVQEAGSASAEGTVINRSGVEQKELSVYAIARRSGRTVAAGRAVLPTLAAHGSDRFQIYFIGDPSGARLQLSAPATSG